MRSSTRHIELAASLLALAALLAARTVRAQINIERLRSDLRKAPAQATLEGSFTGRAGNVESVVAGAAGVGAASAGRHRFFGSISGDYARFGGEVRVSKSFVHLRYGYELLPWLLPEAFVQQQQDKFQRLQVRELFGLGPRFVLVDLEDFTSAYGTAYMLEFERISVATGAPDDPQTHAHRWSHYLSTTWRPEARVRFFGTVYVQPRFDIFTDLRVLFEAALMTELTKRLAVKVVATVRHDTRPPTEVKRTDAEVKNSIVVQF